MTENTADAIVVGGGLAGLAAAAELGDRGKKVIVLDQRIGAMIDGERPSVPTPPPVLGHDTDAILASLGYDSDQIEAMRQEGTI